MVNYNIFATLLIFAPMVFALPRLPSRMPYVPSEEGLARLLMNAHLSGKDPERAMMCFNGYLKNSGHIGEEHRNGYVSCLENSRMARQNEDRKVNLQKRDIVMTAQAISQRLARCNALKNNLDLFNCHAERGSNNTRDSYIISTNASDFVTNWQESYRSIEWEENKCIEQAKRVYVERATRNYDILLNCLNGIDSSRPPLMMKPEIESGSTEIRSSSTLGTTQSTEQMTSSTTSTPIEVSTSSAIAESSSTAGISVDLPVENLPAAAAEEDSSIKSI